MRRADKLVLISSVALVLYWLIIILLPDVESPFASIYTWALNTAESIGYLGAFIVSFLGNVTILFPIPYVIIPFIQGGLQSSGTFLYDPTIIGLVCALGALLGEMVGYAVGYGGSQFIGEEQTSGFRRLAEEHPKATPIIIWFLALTPIPDDPLIVPLGAAKYPWWKIAIPSFIGKAMMLAGIAWAGRFGFEWVASIFASGTPTSITAKTVEVVTVFLVVLAIYVLARIDWSKITGGE